MWSGLQPQELVSLLLPPSPPPPIVTDILGDHVMNGTDVVLMYRIRIHIQLYIALDSIYVMNSYVFVVQRRSVVQNLL